MRPDLILLCFAYVLSQFFRAFLAVLTAPLEAELGVSAADLAFASGVWFLVFAGMQLPVGWALDTLGPRRTSSALLLVGGGGGAALFAIASAPLHLTIAMGLIAVGCSPVLMASYYIFARGYPPRQFATLAALVLGIGSLGNIVAAYPMAWASETIGWRAAMLGLSAICVVTALGLAAIVRDPDRAQLDQKGSVFDLLRIPALWLILPLMLVNYLPAAAIRGLWIGPYLDEVFGWSVPQIGWATLVMGMAMVVGALAYGPLDRVLGTRKWVILTGMGIAMVCAALLALAPAQNALLSVALMAGIGCFSMSYPMLIAHARSYFPPHLAGRGVTLMNLLGIGGVGVIQSQTGWIVARAGSDGVATGYATLFGFFAIMLFLGLLPYFFSQDRVD